MGAEEEIEMKNLSDSFKKDISLVLCGQAGQGIQTVEKILVYALKLSGYHIFATKEYMSRVRGGLNSTQIRVSSHRVAAYTERIDILVPFDMGAFSHLEKRISAGTRILADSELFSEELQRRWAGSFSLPFAKKAVEIGGIIYINSVAAGALLGLFGGGTEALAGIIRKIFPGKSEEIIRNNEAALIEGYQLGKSLVDAGRIAVKMDKDPQVKNEILINGAEAVGLGALSGGCDFLSSYPMSPSTGVMVFLARQAENYGLVVEQAEDEIAAVNMALGASYAGARSMVTTSGGGFALMTEGVSLAGMIETPLVFHVAQRPGPATGLPTRTEQADLELVLYSGHGEFPRIIFAPGSLEEAFYLTQKAFDLANKHQIPVFILTDQYMIDSYYNTPPFDPSRIQIKKYFVETTKEYRRYRLTKSGVSPRGIPGFGEGLVGVDSDEHDESAHITEDLDIRTAMVDKRLKKRDGIEMDILPPELTGLKDYRYLVVGWGSTSECLKEALLKLGRKDVSLLHFKQVYPLYAGTADLLRKAEKTVVIEGNASGQLAKLIKLHSGLEVDEVILKYNGLPFSVEEIVDRIRKILPEE